jgi:hypothetical protein
MAKTKTLLMYMHLTLPRPTSQLISWVIYDADESHPEVTPNEPSAPYPNVLTALQDGWDLVQAPDQRAPIHDHDLDIIGYEFILQKRIAVDES